ncbi:hypothetical protein C1645_830465 [Glomus cerebriforme]|uniref:Uncharacterized protein n=1 Tax=Glomus cerebriforme TaxID=658196 RepID=A0A397SHZ2_9GLOM|nr:hypothetical protein C1645_830465 [Glomus cerebriforme]
MESSGTISTKDYKYATDQEAPTSCRKEEESRKHEDIGMESGFCSKRRQIEDFCSLYGNCAELHNNTNNVANEPLFTLSKDSEQIESKSLGHNMFLVVDAFVDKSVRYNIAASISRNLSTNGSDPKMLEYYYQWVAELGFEHIIVIREMSYEYLKHFHVNQFTNNLFILLKADKSTWRNTSHDQEKLIPKTKFLKFLIFYLKVIWPITN